VTDRAQLCLTTPEVRQRAHRWVDGLPHGTRVEFRGPQRTPDQNDKMWAMLTDVSVQMKPHGRDHAPAVWKVVFLAALGQEMRYVPSLDGKTFLPLGLSSSKLSKREMSDLIELMLAWGAENGIAWTDPMLADEARAA
jgi:hypothetical protein